MHWEKDIEDVLGMTTTGAGRLVDNKDEFHKAIRGATPSPGYAGEEKYYSYTRHTYPSFLNINASRIKAK